jgi:hypothetical protein
MAIAKKALQIDKSMMVTTSNWGPNKTFKLIPVSKDCPYVEAIFDPGSKILAVISTIAKETYHMIDKLDDNGDPMKMKLTRTAEGGDTKKERRLLKTYAEFYITEKSEIETFINGFCVNADSYDYAAFLDADAIPQPDPRALPAEKATNMNLNLV